MSGRPHDTVEALTPSGGGRVARALPTVVVLAALVVLSTPVLSTQVPPAPVDPSTPVVRSSSPADSGAGRGDAEAAVDQAESKGSGPWRLPLAGPPHVSRPFQPPPTRYGPGHRGVDLVAPTGTPVRAAGTGVVVWSGTLAGRGVVSIDHGPLRTTYEPVHPLVPRGQDVSAGDVIGYLDAGHPGCAPHACLHWGARSGEDYIDPLSLVAGRVRLLPRGHPAGAGP